MARKILILYALCFGFVSFCPAETTLPLVRFSLKTDKIAYQTGEGIIISTVIQNLSSHVVYLQTLRPFVNTKLIIATPSGRKFMLADDRGPFAPTDYSAVLPSQETEYAQLEVTNVAPKNDRQIGSELFGETGDYELNMFYQDMTPSLTKAIKGIFSADPIKITVAPLKKIAHEEKETKEGPKNVKQNRLKPQKTAVPLAKNDAKAADIFQSVYQENSVNEAPIDSNTAVIIAERYLKNQKEYTDKKINFLFISDTPEKGFWEVSFEEATKANAFHVIKVSEKTGEAKEIFFLE